MTSHLSNNYQIFIENVQSPQKKTCDSLMDNSLFILVLFYKGWMGNGGVVDSSPMAKGIHLNLQKEVLLLLTSLKINM